MGKSLWFNDDGQKGNFSNDKQDTFNPNNGYIGVRLQQGVPLLDRDWNELEDIRRYQDMILRKLYIGNGSPDDGFKISQVDNAENFEIKISPGRCMVDGLEVVNNSEILYSKQTGVSVTPRIPLDMPTVKRSDTVYLDVWIREITGKDKKKGEEGYDLNNPQDVNIETCCRHKIEWLVNVDKGRDYKISQGHTPTPAEKDANHHFYDIAGIDFPGPNAPNAPSRAVFIDLREMPLANVMMANSDNNINIVNIGTGTPRHISEIQVLGDLVLQPMPQQQAPRSFFVAGRPVAATMIWTDGAWLHLNENWNVSNKDPLNKMVTGARLGGRLISASLNIGGAGPAGQEWDGDPGDGNVWIKGDVTVKGKINGAVFPPSGSDIRLKSNIAPLTDVLDKLDKIRGISFEWNELDPFGRSGGKREIGLIAQEVENVFPELITTWGDKSYLGIDYERLTGVLVEAIKELKAQNESYGQEIKELKEAIAKMTGQHI